LLLSRDVLLLFAGVTMCAQRTVSVMKRPRRFGSPAANPARAFSSLARKLHSNERCKVNSQRSSGEAPSLHEGLDQKAATRHICRYERSIAAIAAEGIARCRP
jgi:hypothetical protein